MGQLSQELRLHIPEQLLSKLQYKNAMKALLGI